MQDFISLRKKIEEFASEKERMMLEQIEIPKFARIKNVSSPLAWYAADLNNNGIIIDESKNEEENKTYYRIILYRKDENCLEESEYVQSGWIPENEIEILN